MSGDNTSSTILNGGIVIDVTPRSTPQTFAIAGRWSGGNWRPKDFPLPTTLYRGGDLVGTVDLIGIALSARAERDAVLSIRSSNEIAPELNDVLVFGEGAYASIELQNGSTELEDGAVQVKTPALHGIVIPSKESKRVLIFNNLGSSATLPQDIVLLQKGREHHVSRSEVLKKDQQPEELELHLDSHYSKIPNLVKVLGKSRRFFLTAGQETSLRMPAPEKGRMNGETYRLFEPLAYAKAGSTRFVFRAAEPLEPSLFVSSNAPLILFEKVMRAAAAGNGAKIASYIRDQFFSPERVLKTLIELVSAVLENGGGYIKSGGEGEIARLDAVALSTLQSSLSQIEIRTLSRSGTMTALESERGWLRLISVDGSGLLEEWTIRYEKKKWGDTVAGKVPRVVQVTFETQSKEGAKHGGGLLTAFSERLNA